MSAKRRRDEPLFVHAFEEWADTRPNATAVSCGSRSLTYAQLNTQANRLARLIAEEGVGAETPVGVFLDRSVESVLGFLAVLKAGGAYLPLDPNYPDSYLSRVVTESDLAFLVTRDTLRERVTGPSTLVCLDGDAARIAAQSSENLVVDPPPSSLAYIVFTSGSTGYPKGATVPHRALSNLVSSLGSALDVTEHDRVLQQTSFAFDVSISDMGIALARGAQLHVSTADPGPELLDVLVRERITLAQVVPSVLLTLPEGELPDLRTLVVGGEPAQREVFARFAATLDLRNAYGPTETAVTATCGPMASAGDRFRMGTALDGVGIQIVDATLRPVEPGATGEICVSGEGVARGYLGRPGLTADRFVPDPSPGNRGGRIYRTGDLGRLAADGVLEFAGRADDQVKLRGFRIELGEVEAALAEHPAVREAAVRVQPGSRPGDEQLAAHVVPAPGARPDLWELRDHVRGQLPAHMVPALYAETTYLPRSPAGKVDRKALPQVETRTSTGDTPPDSEAEHVFAGIWSDVLGVSVDGGDSFAELGGSSLSATQVVSRARDLLDVDLSVAEFLEAQQLPLTEVSRRIEDRRPPAGEGEDAADGPRRLGLDDAPTSFPQQRLWLLDRLLPHPALYTIPVALRLSGELDPGILERVLDEIEARHQVLRTTLTETDGAPRQQVHPGSGRELRRVVLERWDEARVRQMCEEEAQRGFDLARGPLWRSMLVSGPPEHVLLMTFHHSVGDGWSGGVLLAEISMLYRAFARGEPSPLPELPIQYTDYAVWQREQLRGGALDEQLRYWSRWLAGAPELVELPADRPRPARPSYRGAVVDFTVPADVLHGLHSLARAHDATLFVVVLAAFQTFVSRVAGVTDVVVGSAVANRQVSQAERLIGFFTNTLVMRTDLGADPSFAELLDQVRLTAYEAYDNQDVPFERIVEELQPARSMLQHPLVQIMFSLQNQERGTLDLPGVAAGEMTVHSGAAKFDLWFDLRTTPSGHLAGSVEYATDLYDRSTVERFTRQFRTLLGDAAARPDVPASRLRLLDPTDRAAALASFDDTARPYPREPVHALFERQCAETPGAIAIVAGRRQVTYRDLNRDADLLAGHLRARGAGRGAAVGVCLRRGADAVIAMLGVLKTGACFLPLDPDDPARRLAHQVTESGAELVVTSGDARPELPADVAAVMVDGGYAGLGDSRDPGPEHRSGTDDLAYVMYTSGSTGRPKGIMVPHRAVARLVFGGGYADLGPATVLAQMAPVTFDASTFEIWGALLRGGRLVILDPRDLMNGQPVLRDSGVTTAWLTASLFNLVVDQAVHTLDGVRELLIGGEALSPAHVRRGLERLDLRLVNGYGPTESCTFACTHPIGAPPGDAERVPIGEPIGNTRVYVLDANLEPVPPGAVGEIHIAGAGLARGYLGQPGLTADRFVPDPFGPPGERMYRTGDLGRAGPNGALEFCGRTDDQLKIQGHRVEPGEVAAALAEHPEVREAVVVPQGEGGTRRLVGYVVRATGDDAQTAVRDWATVFDDLYAATEEDPAVPADFNIAGWRDSATGAELGTEAMAEWVEHTVARIRRLRPQRVLEIGAGTGLLLHRVAPETERYVATDIAPSSLRLLESGTRDAGLGHVRLLERPAHDLSGLADEAVDTVVLNSVAQYFPGSEYLADVLRDACALVGVGGRVFLGDVRSEPLRALLHAGIEAADTGPAGEVHARVLERIRDDEELCVSPAFLLRLADRIPGVTHVEIAPKRGREHNELTRFRYDAVLHMGATADPVHEWHDWESSGLDTAGVEKLLAAAAGPFGVRGVPNARTAGVARWWRDLRQQAESTGAGAPAARLDWCGTGTDPEDLATLAARHSFEAHLNWAGTDSSGRFDVVFAPAGAGDGFRPEFPHATAEAGASYFVAAAPRAGDPHTGARLRAHLARTLPDWSLPGEIVVVDRLPRNANGKVDRAVLPRAGGSAPAAPPSAAPRTDAEKLLGELFASVLDAPAIGVHDSFFDLGGHSLSAARLAARIGDRVGIEFPLRAIFEKPALEELAQEVERLVLADIESLPEEEILKYAR